MTNGTGCGKCWGIGTECDICKPYCGQMTPGIALLMARVNNKSVPVPPRCQCGGVWTHNQDCRYWMNGPGDPNLDFYNLHLDKIKEALGVE